MNCKKCGTELQDNIDFCPDCGESVKKNEVKALGMKWHKFNAYCKIPFNAIMSLLVSVLFLPGVLNKLISELLDTDIMFVMERYTYFLNDLSVKVLNIIVAFIMIVFAFYYAYISFALIKFKKGALKHLYCSLILIEAISLIYIVALILCTKNLIDFDVRIILMLIREVVTRVVSFGFWILIYTEYYKKRKHLFVN